MKGSRGRQSPHWRESLPAARQGRARLERATGGKPTRPGPARLFTWPGDEAIKRTGFNPMWIRAWKRAGIPDRGRKNGCHVLRHTAASAWLSAGLGLAKVAAYLGDTQEVVLRTYSHFMPGDDDRARDIMDAFFAATEDADQASAPDVPGASR